MEMRSSSESKSDSECESVEEVDVLDDDFDFDETHCGSSSSKNNSAKTTGMQNSLLDVLVAMEEARSVIQNKRRYS